MKIPGASIAASAGMVVLTLAVFRSAQLLAPETCVRKFIEAVRHDDAPGAQSCVAEGLDTQEGSFILQLAKRIGPHSKFQFTDHVMAGDEAVVVSTADSPDGSFTDQWKLIKVNGQWRISAIGTLQVYQSMFR